MPGFEFRGQAVGVIVLGALWSAQPAIVKYSAVSDDSPTAFMLSASAIVAALLIVYNLLSRQSLASIATDWRFYQASALLGFFLPLLTRLYISDTVPLYLLTVAVAMTPACVALISRFYLGHTLSWIALWSVMLGILGTVLSVFSEITSGDVILRLKAMAVLLIPIAYAIHQVFIYKACPKGLTTIQVATGESTHTLLMAVIFVAVMAFAGGTDVRDAFALSPAIVLWGAITALETVVFFWFSRRAHPLSVSVAIYAAIGFGIIWGWIFFGEEVSTLAIVGMMLIALSAAGIAYQGNRDASAERTATAELA
jgi:drug/metabolite transporter (DMT)-like permease